MSTRRTPIPIPATRSRQTRRLRRRPKPPWSTSTNNLVGKRLRWEGISHAYETMEHNSEVASIEARGTDATPGGLDRAATPAGTDSGAKPAPKQGITRRRKLLIGALGALVLVALVFGIPWIRFVLSTVSTDDAYVNGHVTFVAPRVHGQVARVLVDDNNRVHKGDLLVELDKEPFQDAVAVKKAAVDTAEADLQAAQARCVASRRRPGATAGNCSWPWRMSKTRSRCCMPGSPTSRRRRRRCTRRSRSSTGRRSWWCRRPRAASSMINVRQRCRLPRQASSRRWRMRTKFASRWACRRCPTTTGGHRPRCRPISIRPFPRCGRRRPI